MITKETSHLFLTLTKISILSFLLFQIITCYNFLNAQEIYDENSVGIKLQEKYAYLHSRDFTPFYLISAQSSLNNFNLIKAYTDNNIHNRGKNLIEGYL